MPETIYKLQPDRTIHLRGFQALGAAAAVHAATPNSFEVSGVFRDPADFAVLVLYDADNFFEHPRLKYLPDFNFSGLTLQFDVRYENLMPLNSRKYPTIDWPFLDVALPDGSARRVRLSDHAEVVAEPDEPARGEFNILGDNLQGYDRLVIWYQNLAFDYIVPGKVWTVWNYTGGVPGNIHSVIVANRSYVYTEQPGDTGTAIAQRLAALINGEVEGVAADPEISASTGTLAGELVLRTRLDNGSTVGVSGSGAPAETLHHIKATTVCRALADMINGANYAAAQTPYALAAEAVGTKLKLRTVEGGYDADFITLYAVAKNEGLRTAEGAVGLKGGLSTAVLRVTLDFDALSLPEIRSMWLTFAPRLANGAEYEPVEWRAQFSGWAVTGPEQARRLRVAAPGSVRVNCLEPACTYQGAWADETGFYHDNAARRAVSAGTSVTIRYHCGQPHELWLGTALGNQMGSVAATLDGAPLSPLSLNLTVDPPVVTRRRLAAAVAAGEHVVELRYLGGEGFVLDFLEAAVPGDVPDALAARNTISATLDYSTDHAYKLPPSRILWMMEKLGLRGPLNEYIGVFWWNERKGVGGNRPQIQLDFSGEFAAGDQILLSIGGQVCGKSVFPSESTDVIAKHFEYLINATYVGVWAKATGSSLTIHARAATDAYEFPVTVNVEPVEGSTGQASGGGALAGGTEAVWEVDAEAETALNRAARDWHADFYAWCAARGFEVATACSMELVNPPASFAARYPDGAPVRTDVGFAGLHSTHCAFHTDMLTYHQRVYGELAGLMAGAGLTPSLQCGEFTWWYFTNYSAGNPQGGMAYYDSETSSLATATLGREIHTFRRPDDDPNVNGGADAAFLRGRLRDYAAGLMAHVRGLYPGARFEVLFPYDVNHPQPRGVHQLGGRLNRFVNLPVEWESPGASGFDGFKLETLDFGAWSRDLDLVRECQRFAAGLGWPAPKLRMMTPVFRAGYPFEKEIAHAFDLGFGAVSLWAFDHVCIYGLELGRAEGRSAFQG